MKMSRTLTQWAACNPKAMAEMSPVAIHFAFGDMKQDILLLAGLLAKAAYPKRGTKEESMTIVEFAEMVQKVIPHKEAVENL
jgi:hypothetical protein